LRNIITIIIILIIIVIIIITMKIIIITITIIIMITIKGIMPQKHHLIARAWQFGFAKEYIISAGDTFRPLKMKSCLFQTGKRSSLRTNERTNE
jgi:hypothetical protein